MHKFVDFDEVQFIMFSFVAFVISRNHCEIQGHEDLFLCFLLRFCHFSSYIEAFDLFWINLCRWCEVGIQLYSVGCGHPVTPASLVDETVLFPVGEPYWKSGGCFRFCSVGVSLCLCGVCCRSCGASLVWEAVSSNFAFLFQDDCVPVWDPSPCHVDLRISIPVLTNTPLGRRQGLHWPCRWLLGGGIAVLTMWSLQTMTGIQRKEKSLGYV